MERKMTHVEELFDRYCMKHGLCDNCKYFKDKRVTDTHSCNEVYAEDYYKTYGKQN